MSVATVTGNAGFVLHWNCTLCGTGHDVIIHVTQYNKDLHAAIDEMVGVARDIGYSSNNSIAIIGDVASAMYDLGYRKEVK